MEALSRTLKPYGGYISTAASTFTFVHFLSGALVCNAIRKKGSTAGFPLVPFLAGFVISSMVTRFGVIVNDMPTVKVNLIGVGINIIYICFYYMYTNNVKDKTVAFTQMGYAGAFIAAVFAYTLYEDPEVLPVRYGLMLSIVVISLVGSPLLRLGDIIRKKSVAGLPFPMICSGTIISFLWLLHGIVTLEYFTIGMNTIIFLLSLTQLSLFAIYPSKPGPLTSKKRTGKKIN